MTALVIQADYAPPAEPTAAGRRPFRYTLDRYHAAIAAGIITENDKVELIFGEIVEQKGIGKKHADCLDKVAFYFFEKFGKSYLCRHQNPISFPDFNTEPEPDFAIIDKASYASRTTNPLPEDVKLLIEIADATLEYDRTIKAKLYALAGIAEYWIINVRQDQVEVHLDPDVDSGDYASIQRYPLHETFNSPFCGSVVVADLMPDIPKG